MLLDDARHLIALVRDRLEPRALAAFDLADGPEEGLSAVATLSIAISLKRLADVLEAERSDGGRLPVFGPARPRANTGVNNGDRR